MDTAVEHGVTIAQTTYGTGRVDYVFGEYDQGNIHLVLSDGTIIHVHDRLQGPGVITARLSVGRSIRFEVDRFGIAESLTIGE